MRFRRAPLIITLLLIGALLGGVGSAGASPRISYGSIEGTITNAGNGCAPFDSTHVLWVDAWDGAMNRYLASPPIVTDGSGFYSIPDLPQSTYKVRIRVYNASAELVAFVWYGGSTTYDTGDAVEVYAAQATNVSACVGGYTGGTFKGKVTSPAAGFDPTCVSIMAFEAASGIMMGPLPMVQADGHYTYTGTIPVGTYTALAMMSPDPGCAPIDHLDQWWKGHSGPDLYAASNADLFSSGATFTITAGGITTGINFKPIAIGLCDGLVPTIVGTTANDVETGTAGRDVIKLFDGDDEAHGGDGKDSICGGAGGDNLYGDSNADHLFGDGGEDYMDGGAGVDRLWGGRDLDQMFGGAGNDLLKGGSGGDLIHGGDDNDRLFGNSGNDNLFGDAGDDRISGGLHNDVGWGGTGIDVCLASVETQNDC
ncbi:MAG: hypothetical protein MUP76_04445 [Acidimicrobiia bacterium]|nr:hypothetical protein [Acidimicrobiia bacterium]